MLQNPMHPGAVLKELYLVPLDMSAIDLARKLDVPRTRIERLIKGETSMTVDTAARLARYYSTSPQYWMNMQTNYDLAHSLPNVEGITPLGLAYSHNIITS